MKQTDYAVAERFRALVEEAASDAGAALTRHDGHAQNLTYRLATEREIYLRINCATQAVQICAAPDMKWQETTCELFRPTDEKKVYGQLLRAFSDPIPLRKGHRPKASLCLEHIGWNQDRGLANYRAVMGKGGRKPWVARITGTCEEFVYQREFLNGRTDYTTANSKGSRGVRVWYILESGNIYEIKEYVSWSHHVRRFVKVTDAGEIVDIEKQEVDQWLRNL